MWTTTNAFRQKIAMLADGPWSENRNLVALIAGIEIGNACGRRRGRP
jgi:hypothetical protein